MRATTRLRLKQVAHAGTGADARLTAARQIRNAALTVRLLGEEKYAAELRRIARGLDAQRREIGARERGASGMLSGSNDYADAET